MAFQNLQAGDVVRFLVPTVGRNSPPAVRTASVLRYLTFDRHVVVNYGACGYVVDVTNFVRIVRSARGSIPHSERGSWSDTVLGSGPL